LDAFIAVFIVMECLLYYLQEEEQTYKYNHIFTPIAYLAYK